jgi:uncharacterized membrane protein YgdD (TMEM256/DUF423 family)
MNAGARLFLLFAAVLAGLAVVLGAFGAHGLRAIIDPAMLSVYQTAVEYHFWHALGLIGVAFAADRYPGSRLIRASGWAMILGILLFSGSLYILSLSGIGRLGMITPFGGLALIAGWVLLAAGLLKSGVRRSA